MDRYTVCSQALHERVAYLLGFGRLECSNFCDSGMALGDTLQRGFFEAIRR